MGNSPTLSSIAFGFKHEKLELQIYANCQDKWYIFKGYMIRELQQHYIRKVQTRDFDNTHVNDEYLTLSSITVDTDSEFKRSTSTMVFKRLSKDQMTVAAKMVHDNIDKNIDQVPSDLVFDDFEPLTETLDNEITAVCKTFLDGCSFRYGNGRKLLCVSPYDNLLLYSWRLHPYPEKTVLNAIEEDDYQVIFYNCQQIQLKINSDIILYANYYGHSTDDVKPANSVLLVPKTSKVQRQLDLLMLRVEQLEKQNQLKQSHNGSKYMV